MARILGLDIGQDAVRGALVRTASRKVEVERYLEVYFDAVDPAIAQGASAGDVVTATGALPAAAKVAPPGGAAGASPLDPLAPAVGATEMLDSDEPTTEVPAPAGAPVPVDPRAAAIRQLLQSLERPPDRVIAALSGADASIRVLDLPMGAAKRIAEILPFQLEEVLPFPAGEAVIDYQPLSQTATELTVLTCAAPRDRVTAQLAVLEAGGVQPRQLAAGAAALDGLVAYSASLESAEPTLVLDVRAEETDVCVLASGKAMFARTLSSGTSTIDRLEVSLKRTLAAFRSQSSLVVGRGVLAGTAGLDPGALEWFSQALGLPFELVSLPEAPPAADSASRTPYARAAALAGRAVLRGKRIDLLQGDFAPKHAMGVLRQHVQLLGVCAALVFVCFAFSLYARYVFLSDEQEALEAQLERVTEQAFGEGTTSAIRARELLASGGSNNDPMPPFDSYDVLDAISHVIPTEVEHDTRRFNFELEEDGRGGRFEIQGTVNGVRERDQIAQALEQYECGWCRGDEADERRCFRDIERGGTTPGPGGEGLNYQVESRVRCPSEPEPEERRGRGR
jgi:Tfp pilus assembly PilM family ATPase